MNLIFEMTMQILHSVKHFFMSEVYKCNHKYSMFLILQMSVTHTFLGIFLIIELLERLPLYTLEKDGHPVSHIGT